MTWARVIIGPALGAAALALALGVTPAQAQPPAVARPPLLERSLLLQLDDRGVLAMLHVRLRGTRAALLLATYDVNRDGRVDGYEAQQLATLLIGQGWQGLGVTWDGVAPRPLALEVHLLDAGADGPVVAATGLLELEVPLRTAALAVDLVVSVAPATGPVLVQAQALDGWRLLTTSYGSRSLDGKALAGPVALEGGALALCVVWLPRAN